ncbi:MAG: amino acid adenylation domain-containing protein [Candidimonas sp.]|nr:MAG: amino acid adenylation domain-containing protein [Candidimonas sp.]
MTANSSSNLRDRLARLGSDQILKLVTGLQERIDTLRSEASVQATPIAVIGVACRFPGAPDVEAFRRLLSEGRNAVAEPPHDRPERAGLPMGGYIDAIDRFDAKFFGIRESEAAHMDPQHRLALEVVWHALEDASAADPQHRPSATGVFLGISTHDYEARFHGAGAGFTPQATTGNAASAAAGRIAHILNITGPALAIDTACSSSLVAVLAACRSLRLGECDMAIAGGVNLLVNDAWTRGFAAAGMLSPSHACRTFDAEADGYVRGEGAGFIVLKRLPDADGDRVRAIVRGGAINHDGRASSLTAPNAAAQQSLITAALADAGLRPADVQVVECHGTGTPLGDPIEVQALAQAYAPGRNAPLLLGAAKTNIGHLEAAAGIAGLIKTVLALESADLASTLHQTEPNPRMAWDRIAVKVIDQAQKWPEAAVRRAGVSSFGFSGTNAHVILEAAAPASPWRDTGMLVLPLSSPDEAGLSRSAATLADWIELNDVDPYRVAASLAMGRHHFAVRAAVVASDVASAVAGLREVAAGEAPVAGARGTTLQDAPKIAFLFTGQGSQWVGMGRDLYGSDPIFRAAIDRCTEVVDPLIGCSLTAVMFQDDAAGGLSDTRLTQPALFVLEYALAERLAAWGITPDIMIGHSLGEWVAACRAGVFSLDDALRLVVERGRVMGSASQDGAMAAVFAPPQALLELPVATRESVDLAAINAPDECVISGPATAVAAVCDALELQGLGTQRLRTSHGFHSRLMDPALTAFETALAGVTLRQPGVALVSNLTGATDAPFDTADYWLRHIREPVRFADGISAVAATGARLLIEIGASPALMGTASRSPAFQGQLPVFVPSLRRNQPAGRTLGNLLAHLFVGGAAVRWEAVFDPAARIETPGYPFADSRYWLSLAPAEAGSGLEMAATRAASTYLAPSDHLASAATLAPSDHLASAATFAPSDHLASAATLAPSDHLAPAATFAPAGAAAPAAGGGQPLADTRQQAALLLARSLQISAEDALLDRGFLELGVDSLALTEAVAALERRWSIAIPRLALFETLATPARLIDHVVASAQSAAASAAASQKAFSQVSTAKGQPAASQAVAARVQTPEPQPAAMSMEAAAGVNVFSKAYTQRTRASGDQRRQYGRYLADSRAVAGFRSETKSMLYPIIGAKGLGSHMTDVDGNHYVDIAMGFGVQLFGHTPAFLVDAIVGHVTERGLFLGPQAHLAGDVAQRICRLTGNARVTFCNSGTEAVMTALRLARHATGRNRIAMFQGSYHGHFDGTLAQAGPGGSTVALAGGTPPGMVDDVLLLDYGDEDGSLEILAREGASLAAVIVEPVQGRRPDRQPRAFLQRLRELTRSTGTALIFDEVLLGFRVALGGAQAWAGVRADLVTYGKIVGGGLPIGVVAGDARFLDALDGGAWSTDDASVPRGDRTFFAGTFNKNPLAMANAQAVLTYLEQQGPSLQDSLNTRTENFVARLNRVLTEEESGISVHHFASLFRFAGASDLFYNHMIQNGVYVWEGRTCFLSTAHDDQDLDKVEQAVRASVRAMRANGMLTPARRTTALTASLQSIPTTPSQQALRMLAAFSPQTSAAYNQSLVFDFTGAPDINVLKAALCGVVDRHEALRTTFPEDGASQIVHRRLDPDIHIVEFDRSADDQASFQAWVDATALTPLDLEHGPIVSAWILRLAADHHRLVLVMPHLVTDGWSMQLMALELAQLYNAGLGGRPSGLQPPFPYRSYVEHTRARADSPELAAYWRSVYSTVPKPLNLPVDRPRPALQTYTGKRASRRLLRPLREALEQSARQGGGSLFSLCLAAYGRLLARLSGQDELVVAIFSAGQPEMGASTLAGYCVGVLPLRIAAGPAVSDPHLRKAVQHAVTLGMAHRDYPYSKLLKDLSLRRDPSRPPLAAVSFNLDRLDAPAVFDGLTTRIEANVHSAVRWELNWNIQSDSDGLQIDAHYNRDLFDAERVEGWLDAYVGILEHMVGVPEADSLASSEVMSGTIVDGQGREAVETLADKVAQAAARDPASPAVRDQDGVVDYAHLNARTDALARRLAHAGVQAGDRVAFRLPRGLGPVVAILASARLGAAFVPLDQEHPDSHHAYVLEDSGAKVLILEAGSSASPAQTNVVEWSRGDDADAGAVPPVAVAAGDIAYVLYTSGSTGRPKGVRVSYGAVAAYTTALLERLAISGPISFAIVSSFAADLGYTSVAGALWTGGALHAIDAQTARDPAALQKWMTETPVDALKIVPAHIGALLDAPDAAAMLPRRALILGGDILTWRLVDRIRALGGACRIFNHYGPTETTVGACMTEVLASLRDSHAIAVPVGHALSGYRVDILNSLGQAVPDGEEGEIVITGAAVAAGYTRPETPGSERFGCTADGQRFYRTGDMGCRRVGGAVAFLGRRDDMIKIRGHRIEPGGLAELLRSCPNVRDAVVLVQRQEGREPTLLAAVAGDAAADAITSWLAQRVPAAMIPGRIVVWAALPLTTNGKIDRQALLAAAAAQPLVSSASIIPAQQGVDGRADDGRLKIMRDLWCDLLQRADVGPDDDFFALGGDSIMAIQIVGRARAAGLGLTPTQVFEAPTPRGLARLAAAVGTAVAGVVALTDPVPLTPIQRWFLETPMPNRNRWCLSAVFAAAFVITADHLRETVETIIARHDALRISLDAGVDSPRQRVGAPVSPAIFVANHDGLEGDALCQAEDQLADQLMDTLDLTAGRLLAAGAIPLGGQAGMHIIVVVHHAVSDMVSWSILADDLAAGLGGEACAIAPASTSWSWWARALSTRAQAAADRLPYWTEAARHADAAVPLPVDHPGMPNREGDVQERRLDLDREQTDRFLAAMAAVFGLRPHEAVLAAVGRGVAEWAGSPLVVDLEGHGRQPFDASIDLSRTVGWFTTRYPVVLPAVDNTRDAADWLVAMKEAIRRIPDEGMTYGLLRYGGNVSLRTEPAVSFNFVGDIGQFGGRTVSLVRLGAGQERAADADRRHLLSFDSWQQNGSLSISCRFAARHATLTIDAVLAEIENQMGRFIQACEAFSMAIYTPSDFTGIDFSQDELDQLMGEIDTPPSSADS